MPLFSLSPLEISRIIEEAFLPEVCHCTCRDGVSLNIQISPRGNPEKGMSFVGIPLAGLTSSRAIANLVLELRGELLELAPGLPRKAENK